MVDDYVRVTVNKYTTAAGGVLYIRSSGHTRSQFKVDTESPQFNAFDHVYDHLVNGGIRTHHI